MTSEIDQAFERLRTLEGDLRTQLRVRLNESDTRFRILDRVLVEVLGWPHDAIQTEASSVDGFVDYTLTVGDRPALVIEAKRNGSLVTTTTSQKTAALSISGPVLKPFKAAVHQVLGYASWKSVPIACVTDGNSWLFLQTNRRDGTGAADGKGWYFPSLAAVKVEFPRFYDLLGPLGVSERRGIVQLNRAEGIRPEQFEEQFVVSPPGEAHFLERGVLANDAHLLFKQFFSGLSADDDREMLRYCFVETPESKRADIELQILTQKLLNGIKSLETTQSAALQGEVERALATMRSETVLIVGSKGSGKSTFIDRFFVETLPLSLRDRCAVAVVDLERFSGDDEKIVSWAIGELIRELESQVCGHNPPTYDDLQGVFWNEYCRWKEGSQKPLYDTDKTAFKIKFGDHMEDLRRNEPYSYLRLLLSRSSSGLNRLPCLVFDNTDQFSHSIQDAIFQLAHALGTEASVLGIVPITDRSVWRLSKAGALQSYSSQSFYLPVPEAKEILLKRVEFVKEKLDADPEFAKEYFSSRGFKVSLSSLDKFAKAVERLFVENDFVSGLIGRLANFDIRRMLAVAERIFMSPEIRIDEVLKAAFGGRGDTIRIHRALIKGEYDRFSEGENSFVCNMFWTNPQDPSSPLLSLYVLWVLRQRMSGSKVGEIESKYWLLSELCAYFEAMGISQEQTISVAQRLHSRRLLETLDPTVDVLALSHRLTIKESGVAHIELVLSSTVYVEQMALATGINSRDVFNLLKSLRQKATSDSFKDLGRLFIDHIIHLDKMRGTIPSASEYGGIVEARKFVRGLGNLSGVGSPTPTKVAKGRWGR